MPFQIKLEPKHEEPTTSAHMIQITKSNSNTNSNISLCTSR